MHRFFEEERSQLEVEMTWRIVCGRCKQHLLPASQDTTRISWMPNCFSPTPLSLLGFLSRPAAITKLYFEKRKWYCLSTCFIRKTTLFFATCMKIYIFHNFSVSNVKAWKLKKKHWVNVPTVVKASKYVKIVYKICERASCQIVLAFLARDSPLILVPWGFSLVTSPPDFLWI